MKTTPAGSPYINVNVGTDNVLSAKEQVTVTLEFVSPAAVGANLTYTARVLAGLGAR